MYVVVKELIAIYGKWDEKIPYYALEDATFPYSADSELIVYVKGSSRIESGTCKVKIELYDGVTNDLSIEGLKYLVGKAVSVPTDEKGDFEKLVPTGIRPVPSEKNGMERSYTVVARDVDGYVDRKEAH